MIWPEDECVEPMLQHEGSKIVNPSIGRPIEHPVALLVGYRPIDIEQTSNGGGVTAGGRRRLVDDLVPRGELFECEPP